VSSTKLVTFAITANDDDALDALIESSAQELDAFAEIQSGEIISLYGVTTIAPEASREAPRELTPGDWYAAQPPGTDTGD